MSTQQNRLSTHSESWQQTSHTFFLRSSEGNCHQTRQNTVSRGCNLTLAWMLSRLHSTTCPSPRPCTERVTCNTNPPGTEKIDFLPPPGCELAKPSSNHRSETEVAAEVSKNDPGCTVQCSTIQYCTIHYCTVQLRDYCVHLVILICYSIQVKSHSMPTSTEICSLKRLILLCSANVTVTS